MRNPFANLNRFWGGDGEFLRRRAELLAQAPIPYLWLLGKTGSGKTSIIHCLTGAENAIIGKGFRPQTRQAQLFSFPDDETPIVQFLDTRGIGEADYDPAADIADFDARAHLVIVTVRATDQATDEIARPLRQIRQANRHRPVLLAVTCLHDSYPGRQHPHPDPYDNGPRPLPESIPEDLRRALQAHYARCDGLFDRAVPIDLTPVSEGFAVPEFGGQRLKQAILDLLPGAYRQTLLQMEQLSDTLAEMHQQRAAPLILAHSVLAATAAAVPVPWVDIPAVMAIQSHLTWRLARINQQPLDAATLGYVGGAVGGRVAARMGIREALKFIPWVGSAVNAAAAFALTYASGWVWNWYFLKIRQGHVPAPDELRAMYRQELHKAMQVWHKTRHEAPA
jgi:uncharacterized protein (DUF697 family)